MKASAKSAVHSKSNFDVAIIYDDFVSGQRGAQTYYRLMLQHGDMADVDLKTWNFDQLKNDEMHQAAIEFAAGAQLIILAPATGGELPAAVESWLQSWSSHRNNRHGSFVAVLDPSVQFEKTLSWVEKELKSLIPRTGSDLLIEKTAQRNNFDFFYNAP